MCSYGNKLIIFGGHSIREDEDDNEILCSYPLDEISVFNTKRMAWTYISAETIDEDPITISDMSVATLPMGSRGVRIYVFAGRKAAEIPRARTTSKSRFSHSSSSTLSAQSSFIAPYLTSITETDSQCSDDEAVEGRVKLICVYVFPFLILTHIDTGRRWHNRPQIHYTFRHSKETLFYWAWLERHRDRRRAY